MCTHKILLMLAFLLPLMPSAAGMEGENPEPEVTITKKGKDTIEEYRINGNLYMMKVSPRVGAPYYLTKENSNAGWARTEADVAPTVSIPKWVLFWF